MGPEEMILPRCSLISFISLGAVVTQIPKAILANYRRRRISVCLQRGVANAINTRTNRLTARTVDQGESFFPGLVEEQSEAKREEGSLIACRDEEVVWPMSAWDECTGGGRRTRSDLGLSGQVD